MSRSRNGMLPAIRAPTSPMPADEVWNTPRAESRALVRIDNLEDRLVQQERTSHTLLDRAYKVKEDIINNLEFSHGSWQEEKKARVLLQEHIRTITDVVRKLSKDIMVLEEQIRIREGGKETTSNSLKNLEMHSVTGLNDLRGRVGRCDASIAKLSADLKACYESVRNVNHQQQESSAKLMEKLQEVDGKFNSVLHKLEKLSSEQHLQLRHVESDSTQQLSALDSKTRLLIEEARGSVNTLKMTENNEREKLEARVLSFVDKAFAQRDVSSDKLDRKIDEHINDLTRKVLMLEEELSRQKEQNNVVHETMEQKLSDILDGQIRRQFDEIAKIKRECRDGFGTVHESITNMKQVMDGKRKLLEDQLRKEVSQIRKMVVLI